MSMSDPRPYSTPSPKKQTPAIYTSYTALINPPGTTPILTRRQIWSCLQLKITNAESFVPAITSTSILSNSHDSHGRPVTTRTVTFAADPQHPVQEEVTAYEPDKLVFQQPDGSKVQNIISEGREGELYMTYDFEWLLVNLGGGGERGLGELDANELEVLGKKREQYKAMARMAVEKSIEAMRGMVAEGRVK